MYCIYAYTFVSYDIFIYTYVYTMLFRAFPFGGHKDTAGEGDRGTDLDASDNPTGFEMRFAPTDSIMTSRVQYIHIIYMYI